MLTCINIEQCKVFVVLALHMTSQVLGLGLGLVGHVLDSITGAATL